MSKTGSKPIAIPEGVTLTATNDVVTIKGKTATLTVPVLKFVTPKIENNTITLSIGSDTKQARSNWGTMASHLRNAIAGVTVGFKKSLDIQGIGFKAALEGGKTLVLNLGFSHPIKYASPEGITITVEKNLVHVAGADKYMVGQVAAEIRKLKKPEPYQGKGIRYVGEQVRRKAGKKVAGSTAA
jgi:large subunit ribosomal protein L6